MESSTIIKLFIFVAVVIGGLFFFKTLKLQHQAEVDKIAESISEVAQIIDETDGNDPERIMTALSFIEDNDWDILEEAVLKTGSGQSKFAAAELVLLRVYEIPRGVLLPSAINRRIVGGSWPWILDNGTPALEPFETKKIMAVGGVEGMVKAYKEDGDLRSPWR